MALTVTVQDPAPVEEFNGQLVEVHARITFDDSYLTAGEAAGAALFGLSELRDLTLTVAAPVDTTEAYLPVWDEANGKIMLFGGGGATTTEFDEVASATDVSAVILSAVARGRL